MITIDQINAIHKLNPQVVRTVGDVAYDAEGNEVAYDNVNSTAPKKSDRAQSPTSQQKALYKLGIQKHI